jgi:hypothetical protein
MDLKAGADSVVALVSSASWDTYRSPILFIAIVAVVLYALRANGFLARLWKVLEETLFANWQLALLGITAIVLSLASGWTTWDGMRNFTGEPVLSLMITFGIQGVMLIVAWLIGESFASGMSHQPEGSRVRWKPADGAIGMILGLSIVGVVFYVLLHQFGAVAWTKTADLSFDWTKFATVAMYFSIALLALGAFAFSFSRGGDLAVPYVQGTRVIVKNAVLWVMFLACMTTSVFFSFDSLFSAIFPQEERKRAAELRAQNQVAGIVADIGTTISSRRLSEAERLFDSPGWKAYDGQLSLLARHAQDASSEIERYFLQQMEERRRAIAQQQERITTAQSGQVGLSGKKISLTEELARIKAERPGLAAEHAQHKSELDAKAKEVDEKRVEAMAEDRGVEGTGKQGQGPVYRQRIAELARLRDEYKIKEERTKDAQKRLAAVESRIAQIERELTTIDGDLAKLKGEAETAEQRIKVAREASAGDEGPRLDPSRMVPAFERARAEFRQEPTVERLAAVQQLCSQLIGALASTPATQSKARSVDCDPKQASEAAAVVFGLNAGIRAFEAQCQGGDRLNQHKTADELFGFARKCLADSGLPSKDTDDLRGKINFIELNRDDKAHRFVVTWNAFNDGNRLAYLALAIAIAIDALVFMSGLFGANAVRSPLSDVPSRKARSGQQLEAIIDTALMPHKLDTARLVLGAMRPITPEDGFMAEVIIPDDDPHAADLRRVMNAGATIGTVRQPRPGYPHYEIRSELFEYLSLVAKREFEANKQHVALAELERQITVALLPDIGAGADIVLSHLYPVEERDGYMAEVPLNEVPPEHNSRVLIVLGAGTIFGRVYRDDNGIYHVHGDFYRALLRIRGRLLASAAAPARIAPPVVDRGPLRDSPPPIPASLNGQAQLSDQSSRAPSHSTVQPAAKTRYEIILDDLLRAIGLDIQTYQVVTSEPAASAAAAAAKALFRQAIRNPTLGDYLRLAESSRLRDLELAAVELKEHYDRAHVTEAELEIKNHIRTLLLCPALLETLIGDLEEAAGPDDGLRDGEQQLLGWLRDLKEAVKSADLSKSADWRRVQSMIELRDPQELPAPGRKEAYN